MKRAFLCLLLLVQCLLAAFAQEPLADTRDYRAVLDIKGRVTEISVAPNEQLWLCTYLGNIYHTENIDSNWHYDHLDTLPTKEKYDYMSWYHPTLDRISFFNADTAIMTGYMYSTREFSNPKNGYYRTTDGGRTWDIRSFDGDGWIYEACVDDNGNAWLGTAGKTIHYSSDYGEHFKALKIPLKKSDRIYALYMEDAFRGIVGSSANEILLTENNWQTAKNIPTPLDQKKVVATERTPNPNVSKVFIWGPYLIAEQWGRVFYSQSMDSIDWQPVPVCLRGLILDKERNLLIGYDDSLRILTFHSPTEYELFTQERIPEKPIDIKMMNGSLYMILEDGWVCRANHEGLICRKPFTTEHDIKEPHLTKNGKKLIWGAEDKQLYIAVKQKHSEHKPRWYREAGLNFWTYDIKLLGDSVAILWDGSNNHLYSLHDHTVKDYAPNDPLRDFLTAPVKKFIISSGSQGCFHNQEHRIKYSKFQDTLFIATVMTKNNSYNGRQDSVIVRTVNRQQLQLLLENITANPEKTPDIQDFNITQEDKIRYQENVKERLALGNYAFEKIDFKDSSIYTSITNLVDSLDNATLYNILHADEGIISTTSNWFEVEFINQNNDTCSIRSSYYDIGNPWFLPWHLEYKGQHFNCFDLELSRFIESCIPADFYGREAFDNVVLLKKIGNYYWRKSW